MEHVRSANLTGGVKVLEEFKKVLKRIQSYSLPLGTNPDKRRDKIKVGIVARLPYATKLR